VQFTSVFSARAAQRKKCPHQSLFLRIPTSAPPPTAGAAPAVKDTGAKRQVAPDPPFFSYTVARNFASGYSTDDFLATVGPVSKHLPPKPAEYEEEEAGGGGTAALAAWTSANAEQITAVATIIDILKGLKISLEQFGNALLMGERMDVTGGKLPAVQERCATMIYNALVALGNKKRKEGGAPEGASPTPSASGAPPGAPGGASPTPSASGASPTPPTATTAAGFGQMVPYMPPLPLEPPALAPPWQTAYVPMVPIPQAYGARASGGEDERGLEDVAPQSERVQRGRVDVRDLPAAALHRGDKWV